jgi:hypothetical protein
MTSNEQKAKSGSWKTDQALLLAYYGSLVKTSQAVIQLGTDVPHDVLSGAHKEIAYGAVLEGLIRRSKTAAQLNASPKAALTGSMSAWTVVFQYVGGQCGTIGGTTKGLGGTTAGTSSG